MAGCFEEIITKPPTEEFDPSRKDRRYRIYSMYRDEVWPQIQAEFPYVGWRGYDFYPAGSVSWREADQSALFSIDPALNSPPFLEVIARQTGTSLDRAVISTSKERASGRWGCRSLASHMTRTSDSEYPARQKKISISAPLSKTALSGRF
jgi:hypothetical protein